jgi:adenylosuccinate synthase
MRSCRDGRSRRSGGVRPVTMISTGPDREQTIVSKHPFD